MSPAQVFTALSGATAAFAVLHGLLFIFLPKARANLFYALFTAGLTAFYFGVAQNMTAGAEANSLAWNLYFVTCGVPMMFASILFALEAFKLRLPTHTKALFVLGAAILVSFWVLRSAFPMNLVNVLGILVSVEVFRIVAVAIYRRHPDAWLIGLGFTVMTLVGAYEILVNLGVIAWWTPYALPSGVVALTLSMSTYLSRDIARTHRNLETQLAEVRRLDALALAHEREAHAVELERRLLEEDNRRHVAKLEEARQLQLSMLPSTSPESPSAEIAFAMWTAERVGGDYYDYREGPSGMLTVAIGDATGHGLNAGLMVGSAKSLFQSGEESADLGATLERMSRGITSMNLRRMNVAMQLVRLRGGILELASAGMPPPLIHQASTGEVEEILVPGPPLGAMARSSYRALSPSWSVGDTMLLMTDGLPETVDAAGNVLGYDKVRQLFREVARDSPEQILERLHDAAEAFAGGRPRADDVTLVVIRSRIVPAT